MTRHQKFKKQLKKAMTNIEMKRMFPREAHYAAMEYLMISIAGSLALIADAVNPAAAAEEEDEGKGIS